MSIAQTLDLVQCFSMQFVVNNCFFLNPEKKLVQIHLVVFERKHAKKYTSF